MNNVLYIIMRKDLPSMNTGKGMAQASHAANVLTHRYGANPAVKDWTNEARGFGTVLVLSATLDELTTAVHNAKVLTHPAELVEDPTYPYRTNKEIADLIPVETDTAPRVVNGDNVNLWRNEITCGFVFGDKDALKDVVGHLPLHP